MAVNDEIFKNLEVYGGSTINERVYNFLGSLGYTGTINDRLGQFEEGGRKGWQGLIKAWGQYTPAQLFSKGQQGVWYEPNPQYLYQDSAGTVPVEADGDPVGLMLDRSRGLALGPDVVTNGAFDANLSGWTVGTWQYNNGAALHPIRAPGTFDYIEQFGILEAGKQYELKIEVVEIDGGKVGFSGSSFVIRPEFFDAGMYSAIVEGAGTNLRVYATSENRIAIDNISVRELPGNHATQSTSAARPIYQATGLLQQYDNVDDAMNVSLPSITDATVITAKVTGVEVQYPVDLSAGSYTIDESHSGIIIREGQLSASDQQRAVDYLSTMQGVT